MPLNESVRELVHRLTAAEAIDKVAKPVASKVAGVVGQGPVKDALSGVWLTHPLHPMLTDLPIGFWTSAFVLDLVGGRPSRPAADRLVALGILSAVPTAASGLSDWSDTIGEERRIGAVHAVANSAALSLYVWSWLMRKRGRRGMGVTLGLLGATAASAGGYLGGHLVYRQGVNVDRNAWKHGGDDWTDVGDDLALAAGRPLVVSVGDDEVLVVRTGGVATAISNICGHAGGPLNEGTFGPDADFPDADFPDADFPDADFPDADFPDGCVTCPWHGSMFRLADGHVVRGPATGHQPRYEVRSEGGRLSVRRLRSPA